MCSTSPRTCVASSTRDLGRRRRRGSTCGRARCAPATPPAPGRLAWPPPCEQVRTDTPDQCSGRAPAVDARDGQRRLRPPCACSAATSRDNGLVTAPVTTRRYAGSAARLVTPAPEAVARTGSPCGADRRLLRPQQVEPAERSQGLAHGDEGDRAGRRCDRAPRNLRRSSESSVRVRVDGPGEAAAGDRGLGADVHDQRTDGQPGDPEVGGREEERPWVPLDDVEQPTDESRTPPRRPAPAGSARSRAWAMVRAGGHSHSLG